MWITLVFSLSLETNKASASASEFGPDLFKLVGQDDSGFSRTAGRDRQSNIKTYYKNSIYASRLHLRPDFPFIGKKFYMGMTQFLPQCN